MPREMFDRETYFDLVRQSLFSGVLTQQQVDGQNAMLAVWEGGYRGYDLRWLAYSLATALHETATTMWPIEEYGHGAGQPYGLPDPETGQTYFGRGFVQLTWRENYARATDELGLTGPDDLEWHAEKALEPLIASHTMFRGMIEGWFRSDEGGVQCLERYFSTYDDDPYTAREIIKGDKSRVPDWSGGVSIGNLIAQYHAIFLAALSASLVGPHPVKPVFVAITAPEGVGVVVTLNGEAVASRS